MERHLSVRILLKQGYQSNINFSEEYLSISTRACTCTAMETKYNFVLFFRDMSIQYRDFKYKWLEFFFEK